MTDEVHIVDNGVSRFGLRRVHLMSWSKLDREKLIEEHVGEGNLKAVLEYEEEELGLHHLRLYWKENEK